MPQDFVSEMQKIVRRCIEASEKYYVSNNSIVYGWKLTPEFIHCKMSMNPKCNIFLL